MKRIFLFYLLLILILPACQKKSDSVQVDSLHNSSPIDSENFIKGIYGSPQSLLKAGYTLSDLGVNALFIHYGSLSDEMMMMAKKEGIKIFVEFPLLNGKDYLKTHEDAWPIDSNGNKSPQADWFMGICPSNPDFKSYRKEQLLKLLSTFDVDGVWLDYVHWHAQFESPNPILPETCFCPHCLSNFSKNTGISLPEGDTKTVASWILTESDDQWRKWRSEVIIDWINDFKKILHEKDPQAKLGVYYCPWYPDDFNGAEYRILGLNMEALYKTADVLSPMIYHGRMGRSASWVKEYLTWFNEAIISKTGTGAALWPIVQASDEPVPISAEEFRQVMTDGSSEPSSGVMMFSAGHLTDSPEKIEVIKQLYR